MRNRPLVDRHARVSRAMRGTATPLERLAELSAYAESSSSRRPARAGTLGGLCDSPCLLLGSRLPLNLRHFLSEQLGSGLRVDGDSIVALGPRRGEVAMRELARAIRRFSAERARQTWAECSIGIERLEKEFFRSSAAERCPTILCLRCACIGAGPLDEHAGPNCMPVNLDSALRKFDVVRAAKPCTTVPDAIMQAIENFRMAREAAGLSHYDLDCFVGGRQLIFTWHPLPHGLQR